MDFVVSVRDDPGAELVEETAEGSPELFVPDAVDEEVDATVAVVQDLDGGDQPVVELHVKALPPACQVDLVHEERQPAHDQAADDNGGGLRCLQILKQKERGSVLENN